MLAQSQSEEADQSCPRNLMC